MKPPQVIAPIESIGRFLLFVDDLAVTTSEADWCRQCAVFFHSMIATRLSVAQRYATMSELHGILSTSTCPLRRKLAVEFDFGDCPF